MYINLFRFWPLKPKQRKREQSEAVEAAEAAALHCHAHREKGQILAIFRKLLCLQAKAIKAVVLVSMAFEKKIRKCTYLLWEKERARCCPCSRTPLRSAEDLEEAVDDDDLILDEGRKGRDGQR